MNNKENISKQIWELLDDNLLPSEAEEVNYLISNESDWKKEYSTISALNRELENLPVTQPSMRFVKNILEQLPSSKKRFKQPGSLLSLKEKLLSISIFGLALLAGIIMSLPAYWETINFSLSPAHDEIQSGLRQFLEVFNFNLVLNTPVLIVLGIVLVMFIDHFIVKIQVDKISRMN